MVSVPHSGTRTLLSITGINAREQGLVGAGTWWHFGAHELLLEKYEPWAHIPIRHPLNVAESWASRRKTGDVINAMLNHYRCMFRYLETHDATFYRMEDYPRIAGTGEHERGAQFRIRQFQDAVMEHVIEPHREFFKLFYEDLDHGA